MAKRLIWSRGYNLSMRMGYDAIRDNRIFAMAYELGWKASRRSARRQRKEK